MALKSHQLTAGGKLRQHWGTLSRMRWDSLLSLGAAGSDSHRLQSRDKLSLMYSELANLKWCTPFSKTEKASSPNPPFYFTDEMSSFEKSWALLYPSKFFFQEKLLELFCHRILNVYFIQAKRNGLFLLFVPVWVLSITI